MSRCFKETTCCGGAAAPGGGGGFGFGNTAPGPAPTGPPSLGPMPFPQHGSIGNSSFNVGSRTGGNTQVAVNRSNPGKGNVSAMMASLNQNNIGGGGGRRSRGD